MALGRLLGIDLEILEMGIRSKQEHLDGNLLSLLVCEVLDCNSNNLQYCGVDMAYGLTQQFKQPQTQIC